MDMNSLSFIPSEQAEPYFISLHCTSGGSDKIYNLSIEELDGGWVVKYANGRRGFALKPGLKTASPVPYESARKVLISTLKSKLGGDYHPVEGSKFNGSAHDGIQLAGNQKFGVYPTLLKEIDYDDVHQLINDDDYIAEIKYDGERRLIKVVDGVVTGGNRKGFETVIPKQAAFDLSILPNIVLDAEQIGEKIFIWDVLECEGISLKDIKLIDRKKALTAIKEVIPGDNVTVVNFAKSTSEKKALLEFAENNNLEGLVFKNVDSLYEEGRSDNWLKLKLWKTLSAIVTGHNQKRSVQTSLINEDGSYVEIGNVTIPPNADVPQVGSVIEIRYLYAYPEGSLFEPVFKMTRTDVDVTECLANQRVFKDDTNAHTMGM